MHVELWPGFQSAGILFSSRRKENHFGRLFSYCIFCFFLACNNLHQEFEELPEWQLTKGHEESSLGSCPVAACPISSASESTQIDLQHFTSAECLFHPLPDSYFKSSLAVIASDFLYHAYHTRISIIVFHRTSAANKFKQLFPAEFYEHTQAQTAMTSNSFTLLLCVMRNKTQEDSTRESKCFNCNLYPSKELNVLNTKRALTEKNHIAIIFSVKIWLLLAHYSLLFKSTMLRNPFLSHVSHFHKLLSFPLPKYFLNTFF